MSFDFNREQVKQWESIDDIYAIDRETLLGKGSYGQVYRGYSFKRDCLVAIKVVSKHKSDRKEIDTLETLSSLNHQYVMGYYGHLIKNQQVFLFIQYCPNGTLKSFLQRGLTQLQVLRLFRELVEGMCYINAKKKMHRDLKPQNILIGPQQDIKISDFGLAQQTTSIITTGETGTPIYAAPQVYLNLSTKQRYTDNCDVWSAGLILYEMLTGQHLLKQVYQQNSYKLLKQSWIQFHKGLKAVTLNQNYHPLWNCFINWLLDFDGKRRPSFAIVLQTIKSIYKQFSEELKTGACNLPPALDKFQSYTQFNIKKFQILVDLCETFTRKDINIRNQFKYLIMFCCLMRYISFIKRFVRNLTYKRLKFNDQLLIDQSQAKNPYLDIIIRKSQILLEQRFDFYNQQVKVTIIPKILNTYCQRKQSQPILHGLGHIVELVTSMSKGQSIAAEQKYEQALKSILPVIQKFHKDVTTYFDLEQLKVYYNMLVAMQISERYPDQKFMDKELFEGQKDRVNSFSLATVKKEINSLKQHIF